MNRKSTGWTFGRSASALFRGALALSAFTFVTGCVGSDAVDENESLDVPVDIPGIDGDLSAQTLYTNHCWVTPQATVLQNGAIFGKATADCDPNYSINFAVYIGYKDLGGQWIYYSAGRGYTANSSGGAFYSNGITFKSCSYAKAWRTVIYSTATYPNADYGPIRYDSCPI